MVGIIATVLGVMALKRSSPRIGGFGFLGGIGGRSYRRRRSGWFFGSSYNDDYNEYNDPRPIFARGSSGSAGGIEIHCTNCGELFVPQAPGGYCPKCGHSAIGRTG